MRRYELTRGIGASLSKRPRGRGPDSCYLRLEPLESRQLLSAVPWIIDSGASSLSVAIPDQPINLNGTDAIVSVRNQSGGNGGPWNVGNTAQFTGTIDTEYVDGSSIQFLAGQTGFLGANSGSYRPDPVSYTGGTINPDGTASGGNFVGTATAQGVFGARFRATVEVFGFPVTVDAAFASFYNTKYDIASDPLPITAGSFPINTTNIGISDTLVAVDGLEVVGTQYVDDAIIRISDAVGPNGAATATVTNTGPLTRQLTIPVSLALTIPVDDDPTHDLTATATGTIVANATLTPPEGSMVGRHLFYNQSGGGATRYDGNNLAIDASDDNAIATDKTAYVWEDAGAATFANVSSYTKGINGIMVDISGSHPNISTDDFIFRVGNNNSPGTWATIGATSVSVRAGAGVSGSDRVTIIWNGAAAPIKQWLEVIVLANADTGLPQKVGHPVGHGDAFFFGNAVGNIGAGDSAANSLVNALDEAGIRANNALLSSNIPITNIYDVGRNASVNATDESAARLNGTNPTTTLKYLNLTTAPAAPEAASVDAGDGDDEIGPLVATDSDAAAGLAAPALTSLEGGVPKWLSNRIEKIDLNSGGAAKLFQYLHDTDSPRSRALLQKFDSIADALGLDDTLLDELLADLN